MADRKTFVLPNGGTITVTAGTRSAVTLARCYPLAAEPTATSTVADVPDGCCDGDCEVCE